MTHTRHALVIGGGVAGPVAAMALQKASIEATVSEAHPRTAEGIGIFLTVASNGIDALRSIDADGSVLAAGFPTPGILLRSTTGKHLGAARAGLPLPDGTTSHTLKRADLHTAIHQQATARGIPVQHGKRLVDVEQAGDGVRALFDDGSEATGDVLIGADGIHSAVRRHIDPNAPAPTYVGLINLGGYAHGVPVDAEPASYTMIFGKRAFSATPWRQTGRCGGSPTCPAPTSPPVTSRGDHGRGMATRACRAVRRGRRARGPAGAGQRPQRHHARHPTHSLPHLPAWRRGRMARGPGDPGRAAAIHEDDRQQQTGHRTIRLPHQLEHATRPGRWPPASWERGANLRGRLAPLGMV